VLTQELIRQIAICRVDLDAIEPGLGGIRRAVCVILDQLRNFRSSSARGRTCSSAMPRV
jgi:hypothetical protein